MRIHVDEVINRILTGACRYCGAPRPKGYSITCGRSECQEAAFNDDEKRGITRERDARGHVRVPTVTR